MSESTIFTGKDTQFRDTNNQFLPDSDSLKITESTREFGSPSTNEGVNRILKVLAQQTAKIATWDAIWKQIRMMSLILRRITKRQIQFVREIESIVIKMPGNLSSPSLQIITRRVLADYGRASVVACTVVI